MGRYYVAQQVAILLKFAQATTDRKVAAGLIDKAADLKERRDDEPLQEMHEALQAPDLANWRAQDDDASQRLRPYLVASLKFRDPSVALPQFDVLAVNQSQGALFGFIFALAAKIDAIEDMAVRPNDVGAIFFHLELPGGA
jgi:hypothetical protein